jgi:hypothetical protein
MSMLDKIRNADKSGTFWKPEPGDFIAGRIVSARLIENQYGQTPALDIASEADGRTYTVLIRHTVLKNEIDRQGAKVGDTIGIRYDGEAQGKRGRYRAYVVLVEHATAEDAA